MQRGVVPALPAVPGTGHVVAHDVDAIEQRRDLGEERVRCTGEVRVDPAQWHGEDEAGPRRAQCLRESDEVRLVAGFERLPVQIESVIAVTVHVGEQVCDKGCAMACGIGRAAPAVDLTGTANHQHRLASGCVCCIDCAVRPDRSIGVVDVVVVAEPATRQRALASDHQVGDRGEVHFGNRVQALFVADVVPLHPASLLETIGEDRIGGQRRGGRENAGATKGDRGQRRHGFSSLLQCVEGSMAAGRGWNPLARMHKSGRPTKLAAPSACAG